MRFNMTTDADMCAAKQILMHDAAVSPSSVARHLGNELSEYVEFAPAAVAHRLYCFARRRTAVFDGDTISISNTGLKRDAAMTVTERDLDLLETLTRRVRILTLQQMIRIWWPKARSRHTPERRLKLLVRLGWIERHVINAHRLPERLVPLIAWEPGAHDPDPQRISNELHVRTSQPARPTEVYVPSSMAACLLGSAACGLAPLERRDHDLTLAAVYIHYRKAYPSLASRWTAQHALPNAGLPTKRPDAVLCADDGRIMRVVHSAGRWSPAQVQQFHQYWQRLYLAYELW
jgi:hypothetical protein